MNTTEVSDQVIVPEVQESQKVFHGAIWDVHSEVVNLGNAGLVRREFVAHTGAVAVLALNTRDEILLLRQYRHPVRSFLWELPAGLLDMPGESWVNAAARELAEEADLQAQHWHTLADFYTSPGGSDEFIRIFLARGITEVPQELRHVRVDEEANMIPAWVPLQEAVSKALSGQLHNPATVLGILAAHASRAQGWASLRAPEAAFELKP